MNKIGLNTILYGPPGTGKTYNTRKYIVSICDNKDLETIDKMDYKDEIVPRCKELIKEGRVKFVTFHQAYGYEEFIEGIKPCLDDDNNVYYDIIDGVFKKFCDDARTDATEIQDLGIDQNASIWKMSLYGGKNSNILKESFDEGYIRIGFDFDSKENSMDIFKNRMQIGDIILSLESIYEINGIARIDSDVVVLENKSEYKIARKVTWLFKDKIINIKDINGGNRLPVKTCSRLSKISRSGVFDLIKQYGSNIKKSTQEKPFVFVIDEINRGNISKIFGELITLIEESKRSGNKEELSATLPYSGTSFSVPNNVYILGTMNTADRSISLMDTALRRRFDFIEMMPNLALLNFEIDGLNIASMLKAINDRITILYDREHTIGHAFFMELNVNSSLNDLAQIFRNKVLPLLQEYFYDDCSKIRLVLGDNAKSDEKYQFIKAIDNSKSEIFKGDYDIDIVDNFKYEINDEAFYYIESYKEIM